MVKLRKPVYKRPENYIPETFNPVDLAYAAGFVDGEGCFFICKLPLREGDGYVHEHFRGLFKVSNTDKRVIDWFSQKFPATDARVSRQFRYKNKEFRREIFEWIVTGDRMLNFCEAILPYLIVKKEACENMITFRKTYMTRYGSTFISEEILKARQVCLEKSRQINSRYQDHPLKTKS